MQWESVEKTRNHARRQGFEGLRGERSGYGSTFAFILGLFSRWDESDEDVPYALAITIEDMLDECDVYSEIQSLNRYQAMSMVRTQAKAQTVTV